MKVALVIPYFGKWPCFFNIFLKGVSRNLWLDVLFFTDCSSDFDYPQNVHFIKTTLSNVADLASKQFGEPVFLANSYKLCDLKPALGAVFKDYLVDYDYWGYGDIDLVYGDLGSFVLPSLRDGVDVFSCRKELLSGSFALFKNNSLLLNFYLRIPRYLSLLSSQKHECLDETAHSNVVWQGGTLLDLPQACFTWVIAKAENEGLIKTHFRTICKEHIAVTETVVFENGKVYSDGLEYGYYHYVCNKNSPEYKFPNWSQVPESFFVTNTGFYRTEQYRFSRPLSLFRNLSGKTESIALRIARKLRYKI